MVTVTNAAGATITTNGAQSAAMVLGLDELIIPVGVSVPVPVDVLDPAQGHMANFGELLTFGDRSDGMQGFANDSMFSNLGTITVRGSNARGIFANGTNNEILNASGIEAGSDSSEGSIGIGFTGGTIEVSNTGDIEAIGQTSAGIRGSTSANATVVNEADISARGPGSEGISVAGSGPGASVTVDNAGGATVAVEGDDSIGLRGAGTSVVVQNNGDITADGQGTVGAAADLSTQIGSVANILLLENSGTIDVAGTGAAGMLVRSRASDVGDVLAQTERPTVVDPRCGGSGAMIVNCASVAVFGNQAAAMRIEGDGLSTENQGNLDLGSAQTRGIVSAGQRASIRNGGTIQGLDEDGNALIVNGARGIDFSGADNEVVNSGDIGFEAGSGIGIAGEGADKAKVVNLGAIAITGADAKGIRLDGDNVAVLNGGATDDTTSQIVIRGSGVRGIEVSGVGAFVSTAPDGDAANPEVIVEGANARGIDVAANASGAYLAENGGFISVSGEGSMGMVVRNASGSALAPFTRNTSQVSECLGAGGSGGLLNCGTLVVEDKQAVGMAALGTRGLYIENSGLISVVGEDATGLLIGATIDNVSSNGNLVLSLDDITVNGSGATGMEIEGDGNRVVHGQGALAIPVVDAILPDTFSIIATQLERDSNLRDTPVLPAAGLWVQGEGSTGISINGSNNVVALLNVDQLDGPAIPATVTASGAGSVGVTMAGNGNRLLNQGRIEGETGVRGGDGMDIVQNLGTLIGGVELAGGNDVFAMSARFPDGPVLAGTVNAGDGSDRLEVTAFNLPATQTSNAFIDGDQFVNFEEFLLTVAPSHPVGSDNSIAGNNLVTLNGTLSVVDRATLGDNSTLRLAEDATLSANLVRLESGSVLTGNGAVGRLPEGPGTLDPLVQVLGGAQVLAGDSPGHITFLSDVEFAGFMEFEIGGLEDGLFDLITVEGDLDFLGGEIRFEFIDGFVPSLGDAFDFLDVAGDIFNVDAVTFSAGGLLDDLAFEISTLDSGLSFATISAVPGPSAVAEPDTLTLFALGSLALLAARQRRSNRKPPTYGKNSRLGHYCPEKVAWRSCNRMK